jgi:hypothetical protein
MVVFTVMDLDQRLVFKLVWFPMPKHHNKDFMEFMAKVLDGVACYD